MSKPRANLAPKSIQGHAVTWLQLHVHEIVGVAVWSRRRIQRLCAYVATRSSARLLLLCLSAYCVATGATADWRRTFESLVELHVTCHRQCNYCTACELEVLPSHLCRQNCLFCTENIAIDLWEQVVIRIIKKPSLFSLGRIQVEPISQGNPIAGIVSSASKSSGNAKLLILLYTRLRGEESVRLHYLVMFFGCYFSRTIRQVARVEARRRRGRVGLHLEGGGSCGRDLARHHRLTHVAVRPEKDDVEFGSEETRQRHTSRQAHCQALGDQPDLMTSQQR